MDTASMMLSIRSGSDILATPPWARMSAGTRSSAMTATAPASSAILACSAVTTSMITPPLSISAIPRFTRGVPVSEVEFCSAVNASCLSTSGGYNPMVRPTWPLRAGQWRSDSAGHSADPLHHRRAGCVIGDTGTHGLRRATEEAAMADRHTHSSGRQNGKAGTSSLVVDSPTRIRNVALVGPSGSGKTSLVEALLAHTGTIPRAGHITEGNTVCDHDPAAIKQQRSVGLALAPLLHDGIKVNLIDTPGYADFLGELRAGLRAADAALFVVCAADGVNEATTALWHECAQIGMPRAVVISRLDHPRADAQGELAACQAAFGDGVQPLYLPSGPEALLGLITQRLLDYSDGERATIGEVPESERDRFDQARAQLIEGIIEQSEDETLMDRYLDGEEISEDTLITDLETAVARGSF